MRCIDEINMLATVLCILEIWLQTIVNKGFLFFSLVVV